jgi:hypothetical protein
MQIFRSAAQIAAAAMAGIVGAGLVSAAAVVLLQAEIGTALALAAVGGFWLLVASGLLFLNSSKQQLPTPPPRKRTIPYGTLLTAAAAGIALGRGMPDDAARLLASLDVHPG